MSHPHASGGGGRAGGFDTNELLASLRRRAGWLLLGAAVGLAAGIALHRELPPSHTAESSLLVETRWKSTRYLESPVGGSLRERLETLEHRLTSDQSIAALVAELEGAASGDVGSDASTDALAVGDLRRRLRFSIVDAKSSTSAVFAISYQSDDPETSVRVVRTLTNQLIEGRQSERKTQAHALAQLLEEQATHLREQLREQESEAARHGWDLTPDSSRSESGASSPLDSLQKLRVEIAKAESLYTDRHPTLIALRAELAQQEKMMRKPPAAAGWAAKERDPRYRDLLRDYQTKLGTYQSVVGRQLEAAMAQNMEWDGAMPEVVVLRDAQVTRFPAERDLPLFGGGGAVAGAALSASLVALPLLLRRPRFSGVEDLARHSGLPVVAAVPRLGRHRRRGALKALDPRLVVALEPGFAATEQYRRFLPYLEASGPNPVVMVTSAERGEGKSTAVANLAAMTAIDGDRRVLLIDADLRRPTVHRKFGVRRTPGLTELIEDKLPLEECLVRTAIPNLFVLPAGRHTDNPLRLLRSERLLALLGEDRRHLGVGAIFVDTPPLLPVVDAKLLERGASSLLFVVRADRTPRESVFHSLRDVSVPVGLLLNGISANAYRGYYRSSPYRSSYSTEKPVARRSV